MSGVFLNHYLQHSQRGSLAEPGGVYSPRLNGQLVSIVPFNREEQISSTALGFQICTIVLDF